ncbi:unnamed protein product [Linum tenue]|uniref:Pectinesterase inhibitor domain-containing protein n=1 Tax=Linum tenue TaxID=586396 RepID=A0AAV0S061_9ROSI|nr:unnamed protein product [Linum tenue]
MTTPKLANLTAAFISISIFLFLSSSPADGATATSLITGTCKQTPDFNLCVSTLTADPRGPKAAGVQTLALIIIDAVKAKATTAYADIKRLLKTAPELEGPLKSCAQQYNVILTAEIPEAEEAVSGGVAKFGEDGMRGSASDADLCEDGFVKVKSPLTVENKVVSGLAAVGAAVIRQLE